MQRFFSLFVLVSYLSFGFLAGHAKSETGFEEPFNGNPRYAKFSAPKAERERQVNKPIGRKNAHKIAIAIGLNPKAVFTHEQYALFISGQGIGGNLEAAAIVEESVLLLTNTKGRPLYSEVDGQIVKSELASYGLFVDKIGRLKSCANSTSPSRLVNTLLVPGGYVWTWARANGASKVVRNIYNSAYTSEAFFGFLSQQESGVSQIVQNKKNQVGMSMAPSIWIANFALIYILNPRLAAKMPAYWTPIPKAVAEAIEESPDGMVPYSDFMEYFPPVE